MPSVTLNISEDQARRLSRGESLTIEPPAPQRKTYIVVGTRGSVYEVKTFENLPASFDWYNGAGEVTCLRHLRVPRKVGMRKSFLDFDAPRGGSFTAVEVSA